MAGYYYNMIVGKNGGLSVWKQHAAFANNDTNDGAFLEFDGHVFDLHAGDFAAWSNIEPDGFDINIVKCYNRSDLPARHDFQNLPVRCLPRIYDMVDTNRMKKFLVLAF